MQIGRCPNCKTRLSLEHIIQDDAGRELTELLFKQDVPTRAALASYLGLFRSHSRDLANDRALKLAQETLALESVQFLVPALQHTVEAIRAKRQQQDVKPLANHNYLKAVLTTVISNSTLPAAGVSPAYTNAPSNRLTADELLNDNDW